jgi:YggT family protein
MGLGTGALFDLLFGTLFNGLAALFWVAFLMRWRRISFFLPGGAFVLTATEWAARPVRRFLPRTRLDWSGPILAWVSQMALLFLKFALLGHLPSLPLVGVLGVVVVGGLLETLYVLGYLVFWVVLASVLLSWLQPQAPIAPILHALAEPFLAPIRRFVPTVGGVDLSPVVLFLALNLLAILGGELRFSLVRGLLAASVGG